MIHLSLVDQIASDIGRPQRKGLRVWWQCPFHEDHAPSLTITPNGKGWKCFGCGIGGGLKRWRELIGRDHLLITPDIYAYRSKKQASDHRLLQSISTRTQTILWGALGANPLDWLHNRGLDNHTIRYAKLGWCPSNCRVRGSYLSSGVTIPWFNSGKVSLLQVRRLGLNPQPRYMAFANGRRTHAYPCLPKGDRPIMVLEGEFDSLLAIQELGHLVDCITLGGVSQNVSPRLRTLLDSCPAIYLAFDSDSAGLWGGHCLG